MNWTEILSQAGITEPPGRAEAVAWMDQRRAAGLIRGRYWATSSREPGPDQDRRAERDDDASG